MDIQFTVKPLTLSAPDTNNILRMEPLPDHPSDLLCITKDQKLWRINCITAQSKLISELPDLQLSEDTPIQIQISPCLTYAAITRINDDDKSNYGLVIDLQTGVNVFELKDYDYHSEQTDFPVAFFQHRHTCHMVYASDWNNLDIINLATGECLTSRNDDEITERDEDALFTEWAGELKISPDGKRIATIGWVWHPIGVAWNFSLEQWLQNKWEADFGKSKVMTGCAWEYFWHSPFAWLDNERLIIWGDPETQSNDLPANNVVIYNAITDEQLSSFDGPTMDIFEIHNELLFSGNDTRTGISVWHWETGEKLREFICENKIFCYHKNTACFISLNKDNQLELIEWQYSEHH
jgi:hypothetical protein